MRNAICHGYFAVDLDAIWRTIRDDLPPLEMELTVLLQSLSDESPQAI